jgi:SAM-dependent methyltransferase
MSEKGNAWEVDSDEHALLALAGHSTREEFERDRQKRAQEVADWCSIKAAGRGFEIGSGEGTVARLLSFHCASLDCNDISASFIERARANCAQRPNIRFHKIESQYLDHLPAGSFDFGYSLNVFIHLNPYDMFNYLRSVTRILKPNGVFYFDACTLGEQTEALFLEHAGYYRSNPEQVRGLLNFNHPGMIRRVAHQAGLSISDRSWLSEEGWLKVLTVKA